MRLIGALVSLAVLAFSTTANAQNRSYQYMLGTFQPYAKVSLNTTFELNLKEIEDSLVSKTKVDPGLGFAVAAGLSMAPDLDTEVEVSTHRGTIGARNIAGVATTYDPKEEVQLNTVMINGFYRLNGLSNARFKLGGGLGLGQYVLQDTNKMKHRGQGLVYQIKAISEYDFTPNFGFVGEAGYIGTADIDVDLSDSGLTRDSALSGITFGTGLKARF